jgi:hypothetical protein
MLFAECDGSAGEFIERRIEIEMTIARQRWRTEAKTPISSGCPILARFEC